MATSKWVYNKALAEQLRINGVKESEVRDIVAQVDGHLAATGEDPVEAFGQPVAYAARWGKLTVTRRLIQMGLGMFVGAGIWCGVRAGFANVGWGSGVTFTGSDLVLPTAWMFVFGIRPWTVDLFIARRRASRVNEPTRLTEWPFVLGLAVAFGLVVGVAYWLVAGDMSVDHVLFRAPRWLLLVLGLATFPAFYFMGPTPGMASYPRAPVSLAGKDSWRSRVRRAFYNP